MADRHMTFSEEFKCRFEVTKAFCDTAKSYIQISAAALALPILFTQALLGKEAAERGIRAVGLPCTLKLSWVSFLFAIGFGLLYQWLAIRAVWDELHRTQFTDDKATQRGFRITPGLPQFRNFNRSYLYGGMLFFFFLGAFLFVLFAINMLRS